MNKEADNKENAEVEPEKPKSITSGSLKPVMPKTENNEERLEQEKEIVIEYKEKE